MESQGAEDHKDHEGDDLLDDLELHQAERTAVTLEPDTVCRHLQAVLEESDPPREQDDKDQWRSRRDETRLLQFQVSVPRECHKDIRR